MLITGGSRGIGAATALLAAERGWTIGLTYNTNEAAAAEIVAGCAALGARAQAYRCDVADEQQVLRLFEACTHDLGPLNCLVNNAGILFEMSTVEDLSYDRIRRVVDVNLIGALICAREAVRVLATDRGGPGGTIVNVSSAAAYLGSPGEFVDYAATKGALTNINISGGR